MTDILLEQLQTLASTDAGRDSFLLESARLIQRLRPHYRWVGFYFLREGRLHVGPYVGKPTPHTVIELNRGICGAAVSEARTIIVDDVKADPRYLACSLETKSEIVIPLRVNGEIIGELDIDADRLAAFAENDRRLLEEAAEIIGRRLAE
ncbi:MAG: GAF domain-containing protein [candidate division Zixibacteria bacterium]|nr:GAF domain-containing protein [candidate division Zixibacteria bacterium]